MKGIRPRPVQLRDKLEQQNKKPEIDFYTLNKKLSERNLSPMLIKDIKLCNRYLFYRREGEKCALICNGNNNNLRGSYNVLLASVKNVTHWVQWSCWFLYYCLLRRNITQLRQSNNWRLKLDTFYRLTNFSTTSYQTFYFMLTKTDE